MIWLPELVITSFYRAGSAGTHGRHEAIDLMISNFRDIEWPAGAGMPDAIAQADNYYFSVYFDLYQRLNTPGKIRFAVPYDCMHYHIDESETAGLKTAGYEVIKEVDGRCKLLDLADTSLEDALNVASAHMRTQHGWYEWEPEWVFGQLTFLYDRIPTDQGEEAEFFLEKRFGSSFLDIDWVELLAPGLASTILLAIFLLLPRK